MDETRICKKCNIAKPLNLENFSKTDGGKYFAYKCRDCLNAERRARRGSKNTNTVSSVKIENKDNFSFVNTYSQNKINPVETQNTKREKEELNMFNEEEIKTIKNIIKDYPNIKKILDNKVDFDKDDNSKTKKTISILTSLHEKIEKKSRETNLNYSEVINSLLKKAFEHLD